MFNGRTAGKGRGIALLQKNSKAKKKRVDIQKNI
jgi:hypothetical protein